MRDSSPVQIPMCAETSPTAAPSATLTTRSSAQFMTAGLSLRSLNLSTLLPRLSTTQTASRLLSLSSKFLSFSMLLLAALL